MLRSKNRATVQKGRWKRAVFLAGICVLLLLLGGFIGFAWLLHRPVHAADGFEEPGLSSTWISWRMAPGAFSTQSTIVRSGRRAGQITLRANDCFQEANDSGPANERDELTEAPWLWSRTEKTYAYSFSLYLPRDFPIVDKRLVLAQWKQVCEWKNCRPKYPVLAIRYVRGILYITRRTDGGQVKLYQSQGEMRGQWLDFHFVTRFSQQEDGLIQGWLNGQQIVRYRGVTAYRAARAYPTHGFFYFKMGLYRDLMKEPMTIYLDDFRKDECTASASEWQYPPVYDQRRGEESGRITVMDPFFLAPTGTLSRLRRSCEEYGFLFSSYYR